MRFLGFAVVVLLTQGVWANVRVDECMGAAEEAAYQRWNTKDKGGFSIGYVPSNTTTVVWVRGNVISYQIGVANKKIDSTNMSEAWYSVRVRDTGDECEVIKVRKF